jgi:hypothetical protein
MSTPAVAPALRLLLCITAPVQAAPPVIQIGEDITQDTLFSNRQRYVIADEVHVKAGVHLTIEDGTRILIRNGRIGRAADGSPRRAGLVFDTGSRLSAGTLYLQACDDQDRPVPVADNRGVFFLGSASIAEKDGVSMEFSTQASRFEARAIHAVYLGHPDPIVPGQHENGDEAPNGERAAIGEGIAKGTGQANGAAAASESDDDVDAISVIGVTASEWQIEAVHSAYSGDDGLDIENSDLTLARVFIVDPAEDALNITSSRVSISDSLIVHMTDSIEEDRDLFDLEWDDGPSFVRLMQGAHVTITGVFGDELTLVSADLPQPQPDAIYSFSGVQHTGQSYIHAGDFSALHPDLD